MKDPILLTLNKWKVYLFSEIEFINCHHFEGRTNAMFGNLRGFVSVKVKQMQDKANGFKESF